MICRTNYLVLHKSEWNKLQKRHKSTTENNNQQKEDYLKYLNEQSQNWIKHWPDTIQGHVYQLKQQQKIEHKKLIDTVKNYSLKKKHENTAEAIKKAKELIFADSCYGRQLLSALVESKTLEERDVQLKFQNELAKQRNIIKDKEPVGCSLLDYNQMEMNETRTKLRNKQTAQDVAKCNKAIFQMQKEKTIKEKEDKKFELENESLLNQLMKKEAEIEANRIRLERQAIKEYETQNKNIKAVREKREENEERKREIWHKYQERIRCREKTVFNKIHNERYNSLQSQKNFNYIQKLEENKNKQYDEFVQKGIERWLKRSEKQALIETENATTLRNRRKLLDAENKIQAELQNQRRMQENSKSSCCRQCILTKCCTVPKGRVADVQKASTSSSFSIRENKLLEDLKRCEKEPTPWSALAASHEQFYQRASDTLLECRYKNAARKVIEDYRRVNCVDLKFSNK